MPDQWRIDRRTALFEGIFNKLLHPRAAKGRKGGGRFKETFGDFRAKRPFGSDIAAVMRDKPLERSWRDLERMPGPEGEMLRRSRASMVDAVRHHRAQTARPRTPEERGRAEADRIAAELRGRRRPPDSARPKISPMKQDDFEVISAVVGMALDQDHDSPEPGWMEDHADVSADEVEDAIKNLKDPTPEQVGVLNAVIGYALDNDHDSPGGDWLETVTGIDGAADKLEAAVKRLKARGK